MKIKSALLSAIVLGAAAGSMFASGEKWPDTPENERFTLFTDTPYCYYKALDTDGVQRIRDDAVYINMNTVSGSIVIPVEQYYYDRLNRTRSLYYKTWSPNEEITLDDPELPEVKPFKGDDQILAKSKPMGRTGISGAYTSGLLKLERMKTTGENTNDYPICTFNCKLSETISVGSYTVEILNDNQYWSTALIRYSDTNLDDYKEYEINLCSTDLDIHVSDRDIGDVDGNGVVDEADAELLLDAYTADNTNGESLLTDAQRIAADIDFDDDADDDDAVLILDYSTSGTDMTFAEYLASL